MNLKIIYEDNNFLVIDKPPGMIVSEENIPGLIVHRLDKDTSGLLVIAKNSSWQESLRRLFKERKVKKTYLALVLGWPKPEKGTIEVAISRHPSKEKQTVVPLVFSWTKGKVRRALTKYEVIKKYKIGLSLVKAKPVTGRMHQIRVHLKSLGHPIIGDPLYNTKESKKVSQELGISRQFLHASDLEFSGRKFHSGLPEDLARILKVLT